MRHLKVSYKGGSEEVTVPEGWKDVPFKNNIIFQKLVKAGDGVPDPKEVFKLFFGMSDKAVNSDMKLEMVKNMTESLNFITEQPAPEVPTHLRVGEDYFPVVEDIGYLNLGSYRDIIDSAESVLTNKGATLLDQMEVMPEMIAIMCLGKYNGHEVKRMADRIREEPTPEVLSLGGFFLMKYVELKTGIVKTSLLKRLATHIRKLVTQRLLKILVIH